MYEQAKWYVVWCGAPYTLKTPMRRKREFKLLVLKQLLKNSGVKSCSYHFSTFNRELVIFCGKKKLKQLIIEANLLGLEDSLIIFERKRKGD